MATYIRVEQPGAQLLEASRRQTLANRQGLRDQKVAPEAADAPSPRLVGRSRAAVIRADELAAFRQATIRHGAFYLVPSILSIGQLQQASSSHLGLTFYSLDTSSRRDYVSPAMPDTDGEPPVSGYAHAQSAFVAVLPITTSSCIALVSYASRKYNCEAVPNQPELTVKVTISPLHQEVKGYFIGRSSVKEITVPAAVASLMAPAPVTEASKQLPYFDWLLAYGFNNPFYDGGPTFSLSNDQERFTFCRFGDVSALTTVNGMQDLLSSSQFLVTSDLYSGRHAVYGRHAAGPGIYALLGNYNAATALTYTGDYNSVVYDFIGRTRIPSRSLCPSGLSNDRLLEYAGPALTEGDSTFYPPADSIENPVWRRASVTPADQPIAPTNWVNPLTGAISSPSLQKVFITDWGRPAYCRQQLLALGFTAADLTP